MNQRTRRAALYAIGSIALLASVDALAHSYTGLYGWAMHHRLGGWQALSWPAEIDVFLVVGELALYVAYLDAWPARQRVWPWVTATAGLMLSVAGNVGHVQAMAGAPTIADRVTAAISPVAAFAGLMIGLLVLKMNRERGHTALGLDVAYGRDLAHSATAEAMSTSPACGPLAIVPASGPTSSSVDPLLVREAASIIGAARASGRKVSQRALAAQLRARGHRFSNAQLRRISDAVADSISAKPAA